MSDPLDARFLPYHGLGRRRLTLLMDATNKCNLRCIMCHFAREEAQREPAVQWTEANLERLEREVLPFVKRACLSAGTEPLMWKRFPELLEVLRRARVPEVDMVTNGLLLTDELADRIVKAGLTCVQLSLDGASKETYDSVRVGGKFEDFLAAVGRLNAAKRRLGSRRPELQFNFTMMSRNVGELTDLVRLAHEHGVRYLDLRHMVMNHGLDLARESLLLEKERTNRELDRARALAAGLGVRLTRCPENFEPADGETPACETGEPPRDLPSDAMAPPPARPETYAASAARDERSRDYPRLDLDALPPAPLCDAPWRQLNVKPDRSVVPCCFWYTEEPLGDLDRESFEDIRQGEGFRRLRWEILSGHLGPNCARCPVTGIGSVEDESAFQAYRP